MNGVRGFCANAYYVRSARKIEHVSITRKRNYRRSVKHKMRTNNVYLILLPPIYNFFAFFVAIIICRLCIV